MLCRKRSSTSAVTPSSLFPGHGASRSNWCATQSRTLPTALRCFASASRRATHHPLDARWTRAVLSVARFHSRNQGSMLSCHAVLIVPSHFPCIQGPWYHRPSNFVIHPSNADSIISGMPSLSVEHAYPLDQCSQSFIGKYPCLACVLVPDYACMYHILGNEFNK